MIRRILSIITALTLCLGLLPGTALAAEPKEDASAQPRATPTDINMIYSGFVFAQGVPIVIRENGSITSIYATEGNLLSGDTDISSCAIYGGWYDSKNHSGNTSITMESGTVQAIFGGSYGDTLEGDTHITFNGGTTQAIYGGSNGGTLEGDTNIVLNGGTVGWVYGGGNQSVVNGTAHVTVNSGVRVWGEKINDNTADQGTVFGGGLSGSVSDTEVIFNGGETGWIYGGGSGESSSITGNTKVQITGGTMYYVHGGGWNGTVAGSATVEVNDGSVNLGVFGGGYGQSSTISRGTVVNVNGGTVGSVYGGGETGTVTGGTSVTIGGNAEVAAVYGGGYKGQVDDSQDGGYKGQVDDSQVRVTGGTINSNVYGGGNEGEVTGKATVTFSDGTVSSGAVYGGGNLAAAKSTQVVFEGGTVNQIYGGGFGSGSSVESASVELKGGVCSNVYGGGANPGSVVNQATVTLGADWRYPNGVCAGGNFEAVTNTSQVIILNHATESEQNNLLSIDARTADDSEIVVRRDESSDANIPKLNLTPIGVKKVVVEYGEVTLLGQQGAVLQLNSLDIRENGQVRFQDWDNVELQELSGNGGQLLFPAQFISGTTIANKPVTVGKISATSPLIIKAEETGWGDQLDNFYFFQGAGVDALTSTDCFFSEGYDVVLRDIPNQGGAKGIYLRKKEAEVPVYISKLEFNQNPVTYNGTIPLTVGVGVKLATADQLELIPNARIQIRGNNKNNVRFAEIQVSDDGKSAVVTGVDGVTSPAQIDGAYITITLPVNAALLDTCQEGLSMIATAPNQYSSTAQLVGPNQETQITITPAPITLTQTVADPDSRNQVSGTLEDGAFYTAGFRWHLEDDSSVSAFVPGRNYQADIILTPKAGHWLSAASIGNTVTYDGKAVPCVFNTDGTVTLKNVKSVQLSGYLIVVTASPAAGGTVSGGGTYEGNASVTVTATANSGYHFVRWTEGGNEVSSSASYTFTATGNRTLIAVFISDNTETKLEVTEGISEVPAGLQSIDTLNTPAKLETVMRTEVTQVNPNIPVENTAVYNVALMVSTDGGVTWVPATKDNFPSGGLTVTLPYPAGTDSSYTFTVVHMFTTTDFGKTPGDTETPTVTNTAGGIRFTVTGLSPISVGWVQPGTPVTPSTPDTPDTPDTPATPSRKKRPVASLPKSEPVDGTERPAATPGHSENCPASAFPDLDTGEWYHEAVDFVLARGLMSGTNAGFAPNAPLSRAMLAQILWNHAGKPTAAARSGFPDVSASEWYTGAIDWASENGIVSGYSDGRFGPNDSVTREQLAAILWRYAGSPAASAALSFTDAGKVSGYALDAMRWAVEKGIISGSGGQLSPQSPATRAQAAQMLMNLLKDG